MSVRRVFRFGHALGDWPLPPDKFRQNYLEMMTRTVEETKARVILMDPFYVSQDANPQVYASDGSGNTWVLDAQTLAGKKPEVAPLSLCVPDDQYYVEFRSLSKLLDIADAEAGATPDGGARRG